MPVEARSSGNPRKDRQDSVKRDACCNGRNTVVGKSDNSTTQDSLPVPQRRAARGVLSSQPHLGSRDVMLTPFPRGSLLSSLPFFGGSELKDWFFKLRASARRNVETHQEFLER